MKPDLEALEAKPSVAQKARDAWERIRYSDQVAAIGRITIDAPSSSFWRSIGLLVVLIALMIAGGLLLIRQNDQKWINRIAAKSAAVKAVVDQGNQLSLDQDEAILRALEEDYARLEAAEEKLREASKGGDGSNCARVPRVCLGMR